MLVHRIPTVSHFSCGIYVFSINRYIESRAHGSRGKHSCPCLSQPPALLSPPLANGCSSSPSSALPGVHSPCVGDGLSTCLLRDFWDLSQDSPQPVFLLLTHLLSPREQAIQMCLSSDSQDQNGFVSHLSPATPLFSQSATESKCYGIVLDYLIFFVNSSHSDLSHAS